jgi:hypothetical protein
MRGSFLAESESVDSPPSHRELSGKTSRVARKAAKSQSNQQFEFNAIQGRIMNTICLSNDSLRLCGFARNFSLSVLGDSVVKAYLGF